MLDFLLHFIQVITPLFLIPTVVLSATEHAHSSVAEKRKCYFIQVNLFKLIVKGYLSTVIIILLWASRVC